MPVGSGGWSDPKVVLPSGACIRACPDGGTSNCVKNINTFATKNYKDLRGHPGKKLARLEIALGLLLRFLSWKLACPQTSIN